LKQTRREKVLDWMVPVAFSTVKRRSTIQWFVIIRIQCYIYVVLDQIKFYICPSYIMFHIYHSFSEPPTKATIPSFSLFWKQVKNQREHLMATCLIWGVSNNFQTSWGHSKLLEFLICGYIFSHRLQDPYKVDKIIDDVSTWHKAARFFMPTHTTAALNCRFKIYRL
jgi:hypothetical protein